MSDYYVTPPEHVRLFLVEFFDDLVMAGDDFMHTGGGPRTVLDPCAGGDKVHGMSYPDVLAEWTGMFNIISMDIRPDSRADIKEVDYLKYELSRLIPKPSLIITNPPFALAPEIIAKALRDVAEGGFVVMLLRLNYFGSTARFPFLKANMPWRVYVHSQRMKFIEGKSGDSIEYAHFVWKKGLRPEFSQLKVIALDPVVRP